MTESQANGKAFSESSPLLHTETESGIEDTSKSASTKLEPSHIHRHKRVKRITYVCVALVVLVIIGVIVAVVVLSALSSTNSTHDAVSSHSEQCSEIGVGCLKKGGHAVDAAIAVMLCIGVVTPQLSGIGGGGFMLIKDRSSYYALDFRETAPQSATFDMFAENATLAKYGGLAVGVPGELRGMYMAWQRFGRLQWNELFQPTIDFLRNGFVVSDYLAQAISGQLNKTLAYSPKLRDIYAPGGVPLREGDVLKRPDFANVLETIATEGVDAFYDGSLTLSIIDAVEKAGGNLTAEDLKNYQAYWREPLKSTYHDQTVYTVPAPSGGPVFLSITNILEGYNLQRTAMDDSLTYHRTIEALKFGFAQKTRLGDPDYVTDVEELTKIMLDKTEAESLRQRINDTHTFPPEYYGPYFPKPDHGTSHISVIDSSENMVSFTSTINTNFGSGVITDNGILLNDEMSDFTWSSVNSTVNLSQANIIEPGKRPQSSTTQVISHTGEIFAVLGGSGGWRILPDVTQVYLNLVSYNLPLKEAVERLRVRTKLYPNIVGYEVGISRNTILDLEEMGHVMIPMTTNVGGVMVAMDAEKEMSAYSDPRLPDSGYLVF